MLTDSPTLPRPDTRPRRRDPRACCPVCAAGGVCERRDYLNADREFARSQDV
jgi:hypothetical protein